MKKELASLAFGCCFLGLAMPAGATMIDLGYDLIYDDQQDITWYDHPFEAYSSIDTLQDDYRAALDWVADLEYIGLTDWRLPTLWEFHLSEEQFGDDYENPERNAFSLFSMEYLCMTSSTTSYGVQDEQGRIIEFEGPSVYRPFYGEVGPSLWDTVAVVIDGRGAYCPAPPVPEPATLLLAGAGLSAAGGLSLRRRKKNA